MDADKSLAFVAGGPVLASLSAAPLTVSTTCSKGGRGATDKSRPWQPTRSEWTCLEKSSFLGSFSHSFSHAYHASQSSISATTSFEICNASVGTSSSRQAAETTVPANLDEILLEPYRYINRVKGKGVRPQLVEAFDQWLQVPSNVSDEIKQVVEDLHQASLLVDDIEDNSKLRRGLPVAHLVYGIPSALNCGNYVYFLALERCNKLGNQKATEACIDEMLNLHRGQGMDMYWRDNDVCPTEEEYKQMVIYKTGGLFKLAIRIMQAFSTNKANLMPLVELLAVYFQIMDDYLNLYSKEFQEKKSYCEDLTEGKFSFPVIHSIRNAPPGDTRLRNIVKQRTEDYELKKYAISIMEDTGSFEYTKTVLNGLMRQLFAELERLGGNDTLKKTIQMLASRME